MIIFVLDASVAMPWVFEDEHSIYANGIMDSLATNRAVVPSVWPLEIANALLTAMRRERIQATDAARFFATLARLDVEVDRESGLESIARGVFPLGLAHRLSSYDASYLELALRRGLPLATQDARLAEAATAAGVEILQP